MGGFTSCLWQPNREELCQEGFKSSSREALVVVMVIDPKPRDSLVAPRVSGVGTKGGLIPMDMAIGHTWVPTPLLLALLRAVIPQVPEVLGNQARLRSLICKFWGQTT